MYPQVYTVSAEIKKENQKERGYKSKRKTYRE
jgi:hypothetical protein